ALLVLGGLALGRDAVTLRLVATGAIVVLAFWPEALMGPSFQMSFAAVVALVALSEHRGFRALVMARDEIRGKKAGRVLLAMLGTGIAVELTLMPIALHHFHQAGMLGALANLVAIPLTTFVVMPFEALALVFDIVGLGAPFWWVTGRALDLLLGIAHAVSNSPLAAMQVAARPPWVFALIVSGMLWVLLWRDRLRWVGLIGVAAGVMGIIAAPVADILVTGDGKHVALWMQEGKLAILRDRAGEYVRDMLAENAGHGGTLDTLAALPQARCSTDLCAVRMERAGRSWDILATRSGMLVDRPTFEQDCARSDIVISDRRLPYWCRPRWLKVDRSSLARTGGLAIMLADGTVRTVRAANDQHPWVTPAELWRPRRWSGNGTATRAAEPAARVSAP
ncbi:MAG: ComEC/Rec2 family competence protein, partial [Sphingobium sp.]